MSFEKHSGFQSFGGAGTMEMEPGAGHLLSPGQALGQALSLDECLKSSCPPSEVGSVCIVPALQKKESRHREVQ